MSADFRIGIDVGGTHTDAVILDERNHVVTWTKQHTSADISGGIAAALTSVLDAALEHDGTVRQVMLGTTHGINAVLERRGLAKVATIRLGAPATLSIPPLISWPADLRNSTVVATAVLPGGSYVDGRAINRVDRAAIVEFLEREARDATSVAITGVFSPAYRDQELETAAIVREVLGAGVGISLSHEIGSLGLLARENATVLNASLQDVANNVASALRAILDERGIAAPTYFAQNDGTLMGAGQAARLPVLTIGSGPANSIRGAAHLTGMSHALIADVGGTSTDFGVLVGGYPREASMGAELAGIKTNFRMPDVLSIGIGGGTIVGTGGNDPDIVTVGPDSVGFALPERALCFGGDTPTLTDAAVLHGKAAVGTAVPGPAHAATLKRALQIAHARLADAVDSMNSSGESIPLVVVGGAGFLVPENHPELPRAIRPEHGSVANAVGVAIAPVSSRWDVVVPIGKDRKQAIAEASEIATSRAIQAGADPRKVEIIEISETPVGYLPQPASRLRVRAAGPLGQAS